MQGHLAWRSPLWRHYLTVCPTLLHLLLTALLLCHNIQTDRSRCEWWAGALRLMHYISLYNCNTIAYHITQMSRTKQQTQDLFMNISIFLYLEFFWHCSLVLYVLNKNGFLVCQWENLQVFIISCIKATKTNFSTTDKNKYPVFFWLMHFYMVQKIYFQTFLTSDSDWFHCGDIINLVSLELIQVLDHYLMTHITDKKTWMPKLLTQHSTVASHLSAVLFDVFSHLLNAVRRPRLNYSPWLTW